MYVCDIVQKQTKIVLNNYLLTFVMFVRKQVSRKFASMPYIRMH